MMNESQLLALHTGDVFKFAFGQGRLVSAPSAPEVLWELRNGITMCAQSGPEGIFVNVLKTAVNPSNADVAYSNRVSFYQAGSAAGGIREVSDPNWYGKITWEYENPVHDSLPSSFTMTNHRAALKVLISATGNIDARMSQGTVIVKNKLDKTALTLAGDFSVLVPKLSPGPTRSMIVPLPIYPGLANAEENAAQALLRTAAVAVELLPGWEPGEQGHLTLLAAGIFK
jgi:hypothetical protein